MPCSSLLFSSVIIFYFCARTLDCRAIAFRISFSTRVPGGGQTIRKGREEGTYYRAQKMRKGKSLVHFIVLERSDQIYCDGTRLRVVLRCAHPAAATGCSGSGAWRLLWLLSVPRTFLCHRRVGVAQIRVRAQFKHV